MLRWRIISEAETRVDTHTQLTHRRRISSPRIHR